MTAMYLSQREGSCLMYILMMVVLLLRPWQHLLQVDIESPIHIQRKEVVVTAMYLSQRERSRLMYILMMVVAMDYLLKPKIICYYHLSRHLTPLIRVLCLMVSKGSSLSIPKEDGIIGIIIQKHHIVLII